jgi:hypothetical protein
VDFGESDLCEVIWSVTLSLATLLKDIERGLLSANVTSVFHEGVRFSSGGCERMKNGKWLLFVSCQYSPPFFLNPHHRARLNKTEALR